MPKGSRTTLFVSSTCYDLSQIRADIRDFADTLGLEPILSELDTFPVNPSQTNFQNCLNAVRNRADLFLLIVGGRYGSINETGKSITNLEYMEASAKGIPKYVFVKKDILALLPIWKENPDANFNSAVDTPKLFEFVTKLRDTGEVWVFPFETAQDITNTLRKQLSYLLAESLEFRAKIQSIDLPILSLPPESLRFYIDKPDGWEYLAFAQSLQSYISSHKKKKLDLELGISFGPIIDLSNNAIAMDWVSTKFKQIAQIVETLSQAFNYGMVKAVGEPGEPGDIQRIEHLASRISDGYLEAIEWTLEFHRLSLEPEFKKLMTLMSFFSSNMLNEIEIYAAELLGKIQYVFANHAPGDSVKFSLELTLPDTSEFLEEMARLAEGITSHPDES